MEPLKKILRTPSALVILLAAIVTLFGVTIKSKSDESIARLPIEATLTAEAKLTESANIVLATPTVLETPTFLQATLSPTPSNNDPSVYIAEWSGNRLDPNGALILSTKSCYDDESYSIRTGEKPAYVIIYEVWIAFTFVNSTDQPNGIISIEPTYLNDFQQAYNVQTWFITIYEDNNTENPVSLPIELPPKTPRKFYFRAIHTLQTHPDDGAVPILEFGNKLTPMVWKFNIVNNEQVIQTFGLYISAGEATNDNRYEFIDKCSELLSEWPYVNAK